MATYYVATYGSNSNNGTSPSTPWLTLAFALGAASGTNPGLTAGDTLWIAPGTYRESITTTTLTGTSGNTIKIYGDPTFSKGWTSGNAGRVRITNFTSDTTLPTAGTTLAVIGDYVDISDLCLDGHPTGSTRTNTPADACLFLRGGNITVTKCTIQTTQTSRQQAIQSYFVTGKKTLTIDRCTIFSSFSVWILSASQTATFDADVTVKDTVIFGGNSDQALVFEALSANQVTGAKVYNCTVIGQSYGIAFQNWGNVGGTTTVLRNNLIYATKGIGVANFVGTITITQTNNIINALTNFQNVSPTTVTISAPLFDFSAGRLQGVNAFPWFAPATGSPAISAGTSTGAPTVDLYGNTWLSNPTIGAIESMSLGGLLTHPGMTGGIRG